MNKIKESTLIIIPSYNEEERLPIGSYRNFFKGAKNATVDFLFVNDGSTDGTLSILKELQDEFSFVSILDLPKNVGKGEAIRTAVLKSDKTKYDNIGYFDADLATPLEEIDKLVEQLRNRMEPYMILGIRIKILGYSEIERKVGRHYLGRIFATVVSNMLKLAVYDTQCGAKIMKSDIAFQIFQEPFVSKWLFDVELIFRLKQKYQDVEKKMIEVPLRKWKDIEGSKLKPSYFLIAPFELIRIYFSYKTKNKA